MQNAGEKQYILEDIMKRRKKDEQAVQNKIKNKMLLKNKKKNKIGILKKPEQLIKAYRSAQKSYAHFKQQQKANAHNQPSKSNPPLGYKKLLVVVRIRGVKDISPQQVRILNQLKLRQVNVAVLMKGTVANIRKLKLVQNYITWGQPSRKTLKELITKKMFGKVNGQRLQINSNELIEKHIGGEVICIEDVVNQLYNIGTSVERILKFIYPFKLTTPEGLLMSRLRKPVGNGGHWGYRGEQINEFIQAMI